MIYTWLKESIKEAKNLFESLSLWIYSVVLATWYTRTTLYILKVTLLYSCIYHLQPPDLYKPKLHQIVPMCPHDYNLAYAPTCKVPQCVYICHTCIP